MAAEQGRPPRVARPQTNMADAAATLRARATGDGAGALLDFRIADVSPFGPCPLDAAQVLTQQVFALNAVLSAAYEDLDHAEHAGTTVGAMRALRGTLHSQAFDGIGSLTALAAFFLEQHRGAQ